MVTFFSARRCVSSVEPASDRTIRSPEYSINEPNSAARDGERKTICECALQHRLGRDFSGHIKTQGSHGKSQGEANNTDRQPPRPERDGVRHPPPEQLADACNASRNVDVAAACGPWGAGARGWEAGARVDLPPGQVLAPPPFFMLAAAPFVFLAAHPTRPRFVIHDRSSG